MAAQQAHRTSQNGPVYLVLLPSRGTVGEFDLHELWFMTDQ